MNEIARVTEELSAVCSRVDSAELGAFVDAFTQDHRRWFFTGQGRSGLVAQMAAMRVMHMGRTVHVVGEATAPSVRQGDILVVVSGSGATPTSLAFAKIARSEGARIALVTAQRESQLDELADLTVRIPVEDTTQFGGSLFEQSTLVLFDAVVLALTAGDPQRHAVMAERHTNLQ